MKLPDLGEMKPHRMVDKIADGLLGGAEGLVNSMAGAVRGAGKAVMNGLDKPFEAVTGKEGPHRIVDRLADGGVDTVTNFLNGGVGESVRKAGEGIMSALDHPIEQIRS